MNTGGNNHTKNARPQKQRPQQIDHSTNPSSGTSGQISPQHSDKINHSNQYQSNNNGSGANNAKVMASSGGGGGQNSHNQSQMMYEPVPGGSSPRGVQGASTLDEMNHGSPVRHQQHSNNYSYNQNSGQLSPKLTKGHNSNAGGGGDRSHQRPAKNQHRSDNSTNQQQAAARRENRVAKSYNMDSVSQRITDREKHMGREQKSSQGNIIALACGPLKRKRYINPKIELELVDFKKEIEEKFVKSPLKKFQMPRRSENDKISSGDLPMSSSIFGQSRIQKGRQLAQSTDATVMQQYLHNNVTSQTPIGAGQLPAFNSSGQGYPGLNQNTTRKGGKHNHQQNHVSADYSMNVAQSHNTQQLSGLAKNFNSTNSSRNIQNQTEQVNQQMGRNNQQIGGAKLQRGKISKPPKYDGSSSRYGNMYTDNLVDGGRPGHGLPKPHHLEELQLRSTHYGGAVDKLLTTQKIGQGFKGLPGQIASGGHQQAQVTPQGFRPAPINFNKNTFQDMYQQNTSESVKVTRVPNINNKTRNQKLHSHLYNASRDNSQGPPGRESPSNQAVQHRSKGPGMPKLQNIGGQHSGQNILPKMESHMRSTHLKLDPIETSSFVNPTGPPGVMVSSNPDQKIIGQSVQFQKGMLTPIDSNKFYHNSNNPGQHSPKLKKNIKNNPMNTSMYRNQNSGVSASQNPAPRRMNDQLSPLSAFELEREQTQQRIFSTYIMPNQKPSQNAGLITQSSPNSQMMQHQVNSSAAKNQPRQGKMQLQQNSRGMVHGTIKSKDPNQDTQLPKVQEGSQQPQVSLMSGNTNSSYYVGGSNQSPTNNNALQMNNSGGTLNTHSPMPSLNRPDRR